MHENRLVAVQPVTVSTAPHLVQAVEVTAPQEEVAAAVEAYCSQCAQVGILGSNLGMVVDSCRAVCFRDGD